MLSEVEQSGLNQRVTAAVTAGREHTRRAFFGRNARGLALSVRVLEILLGLLLCVILATMVLRMFAPLPLPKNVKIASASTAAVADPLAVKNPFPTNMAVPIVETSPDVADTTLDLKLTGVWALGDGGSATIETPDGKQSRFAVGEDIVDGVSLVGVFVDRIIISRGGVREALRFESKLPGSSAQRPSPVLAVTPSTTIAGGTVGDVLRLAPGTDENGNLVIDLYAARNRSAFKAYGLQDGDRLISINGGAAPTNAAGIASVLRTVQRQGQVKIVILRNGQEIPVTVALETFERR